MGKLSAHGHELVRLVKARPEQDDPADPARPNALRFIDHKSFLSVRSDGHVLSRHTARWADSGRIQDWGWKLYKRIKPELRRTMPDLNRAALTLAERMVAQGWTVESEHAGVTIARNAQGSPA